MFQVRVLKTSVMHQSIPAAPIPPPPGNCGTFAHHVSPGGGALANLARPEGRAFAYPGTLTPGLLTRTWFPTLNPNMEDSLAKLRTGQTCRLFSILCINFFIA